MSIRATILLPNYNNERVLPVTFEYLRRNVDCKNVRFLMVDDGSEDASVAVAKRELSKCAFASAEIIELKHEGVVTALNTGLDAIKTDYVLRIDGDATVETPGWALRLISHLEAWPEIGIVGGHVIWETGRVHSLGRSVISDSGLHNIGTIPLECIGHRQLDSAVYAPIYRPESWPKTPYEVDTILGVCVAFRLREARETGGFDRRFNPVWVEDDDFGLAMRKMNKRVIIDPHIKVIHRPSLRGCRQPGQERGSPLGPLKASVVKCATAITRRSRNAFRELMIGNKQIDHLANLPKDTPSAWRVNILLSHYGKWEQKWGFDPINPDMQSICEQYWDTLLCWRVRPDQYKKSKSFSHRLASV
jgi:GT2 family glycosyltransferase